jgi:hypothetical protein
MKFAAFMVESLIDISRCEFSNLPGDVGLERGKPGHRSRVGHAPINFVLNSKYFLQCSPVAYIFREAFALAQYSDL